MSEVNRFTRPSAGRRLVLVAALLAAIGTGRSTAAQTAATFDYRVLATNRTSTMEKELNDAAEAGFRFLTVMGGETAIGGSEAVAVMAKTGASGSFAYRLLATNRTSTMQRELQDASDAGYEYRGQTVFRSTFGGEEVVCILEKDKTGASKKYDYKLLATSKTSTLEKELRDAGASGYELLGMTVAKTAIGGKELVAITRKAK